MCFFSKRHNFHIKLIKKQLIHDSQQIRRSIHNRLFQILLKNSRLKGWFIENFEIFLGCHNSLKFYNLKNKKFLNVYRITNLFDILDLNQNSEYFLEAKLTLTKLVILKQKRPLMWLDFLSSKTFLICLLNPNEEVIFNKK